MKKLTVLIIIITICLSLVGCGYIVRNPDVPAGTYKIVEMDYTNSTTYALINSNGVLKRVSIDIDVPMDEVDALIGSYVVVLDHEVVRIKNNNNLEK